MTFRVGQKVVCVDASPREQFSRWNDAIDVPIEGKIYTVSRGDFLGRSGLYLICIRELANPIEGYMARRFRPAVDRKTDISIFTRMLNPTSKSTEPA